MRWLFSQHEDGRKPVYTFLLSHGHAVYVCVERCAQIMSVWKADHPTNSRTLGACGYVVDATDAVNSVWNSVVTKPGFATFDSRSTALAVARALRAEGMHSHVPVVNLDPEQLWCITSLSATKTTPSPCSYHIDFVDGAPHYSVPRVVLHSTLHYTVVWPEADIVRVDTLHPARTACDTTAALAQYALLKCLVEDDHERFDALVKLHNPRFVPAFTALAYGRNRYGHLDDDDRGWAGVLAEVDACSATTAYLASCRPWSLRDHRKHDKTVQRRVFTVYVCAARFEARTAVALPAELWERILGTTSLL